MTSVGTSDVAGDVGTFGEGATDVGCCRLIACGRERQTGKRQL